MHLTRLSTMLASAMMLPALAACGSSTHTIEDDIPHKYSMATVTNATMVGDRCSWKVTLTYQAYDGDTATTTLVTVNDESCYNAPVKVLLTVYENGRTIPVKGDHSY